jgi:hypothetical protein
MTVQSERLLYHDIEIVSSWICPWEKMARRQGTVDRKLCRKVGIWIVAWVVLKRKGATKMTSGVMVKEHVNFPR